MIDNIKNKIKKIVFGMKNIFIDKDVIDNFHKAYYNSGVYQFTEWEGIRIYKYPSDLFLYQEIIMKNKPDVIIETGTLYGGSALFFARLFDILGNGKVISIDIVHKEFPQHKRIEYITASSLDETVLSSLKKECEGKKVMVILDSDHHKDHVLKEMKAYENLVSVGQYMIVEDGNINGHPVYESFGPGPLEAIEEFFNENKTFTINTRFDNKFLFTANPKGYLVKVK